LPRVAELFEARKPKDFAVISEISGVVSYGKDAKGKRKIIVTPEIGEEKEYLIAKGKHISVQEGDHVLPGDALMSGVNNPHDLLSVKGEKELARYLVDEVQEVLPPAGCEDQRQAHGSHCSSDAQKGEGHGSGRYNVYCR